jgi:tRNA A-37 threonylcarbamoyl transferase component Bud32
MESALGLGRATTAPAGPGTPPRPPANGEGGAPVLPGYEVLGEIARGGMGVVYKARQVRLNRLEAVKMVLAGGHAGPDRLARFRTEVEAVARLAHPNIVPVYQVGEHQGLPYFAMEHLAGGSLADRLAKGPLPAREAACLVEVLARAMQHAHERGIVHRDLKPANVLLKRDGEPKITDFGLAKVLGEDGEATRTGAIMGTPAYLAPEQAEGRSKAVGPAADVYALGATLYECLTGHPPFRGENTLDTLEQVRGREPVPPRQLRPRLERDLETICLHCLRKEPGKRYASAAELADDLRRHLNGEPVRARPVPWWERAAKWALRQPALAALLLVSALALAALLGSWAVFTAKLADERNYARGEEQKARDSEREARAQKKIADDQRDRAEEQRRRAEQILDQTTLIVKGMVWRTRDVKAQPGNKPGDVLYALAKYYALASASAGKNQALLAEDRRRLAGDFADRAVDLLGCAATEGFFQSPENRQAFAGDREGAFSHLRGRPGFEKLAGQAGK